MSVPSRYQVLEPLGALPPAATPRTFLTLDNVTMEEVVVRVPPEEPADPSACEGEVARVRGLHDTRVAPLLHARTSPPLVVHPWVPGYSLQELLRLGPLSQDMALYLTWEATGALAALHAAGLPHGDLHPGNIRVTPGGDVRLVATAPAPFHKPDTSHPPYATRQRYAAPELLDPQPTRPAAASDVYSLALIAYQLFTGRPPLPAGSRHAVRGDQDRLARALAKVDRLARRVPEAMGEILLTMLPVDRRARPHSAVDVLTHYERRQVPGARTSKAGKLARSKLSARRRQVAEARAATLRGVQGAEHALALASQARRLAELGPLIGGLAPEVLVEALDEVLWLALPGGPLEDNIRRAALLQAYRAADLADLEGPRAVLASLLRSGWPEHPRIANAIGDAGSQVDVPLRKLREQLLQDPGAPEATRLMALHPPPTTAPPTSTGAEARAEHLAAHRLAAAALLHLTPLLRVRGADPGLLRNLAHLSGEAATAALGSDVSVGRSGTPIVSELPSEVIGMPTPAAPIAAASPGGARPASTPGSAPGSDAGNTVFSPTDLLSSVELDEDELEAEAPGSAAPVQSRMGGELEEAMLRFQEAQALARRGQVGEASALFSAVLQQGVLTRERFHGPTCAEARGLVWTALVADSGGTGQVEELRPLLDLTDLLELDDLTPVMERLMMRALRAAGDAAALQGFAEERSGSVQVYQEMFEEAEAQGDLAGQLQYLVSLGWRLLELGEITPASRAFMRAKGLGAESPSASAGLEQTYQAGASLAEAGAAYRELQGRIAGGENPSQSVALLEEFLQRFPRYLPALEASAGLYLQAGDSLAAGRRHLELARRALARGEAEQARSHFREVLRVEPEHDESLLALAGLADLPARAGEGHVDFQLRLLESEELFATALHLARRHHGGAEAPPEALARMAELAARAGLDPTPYRVAQGKAALVRADAAGARQFFEAALGGSPDVAGTVDALLAIPGIDQVYSQLELLSRKPTNAPPAHPGGA